ncbi:MAG: CUB domain-containing protein [Spirosomataceae bacterium]
MFLYFLALHQVFPQNPISGNQGFQVISEGNFTTANAYHIHGPLAVGGNMIINTPSMAEINMDNVGSYVFPGDGSANTGLLVKGSVTWTNGSAKVLNSKYIHVGNSTGSTSSNNGGTGLTQVLPSSTSYNNAIRIEGSTNQPTNVFQTVGFDFTTLFNNYRTNSTNLSTKANTVQLYNTSNAAIAGNTVSSSQGVRLKHLNFGVNYLNLTSASLNNISEFTFETDAIPSANKILIINVPITANFAWNNSNMAGISGLQGPHVLWNFYGSTTFNLTINTASMIVGTIFAPNMNLIKNGTGDTEGNLIAKTIQLGVGEIHDFQFSSDLNTFTVSSPINIFDTGGNSASYGDNQNYTVTYTATPGNVIKLSLSSFDTEAGYDFLKIYDGPNTSSPLLYTLNGTSFPQTIYSSGTTLTITFTSDDSVTSTGWAGTVESTSAPCNCTGSLLTNNSFENGITGWNYAGGNAYNGTGYQVCGSYNGYLEATTTNAWLWQQVSATAGSTYFLSFFGGTHNPAFSHFVRIGFYNSSNTMIGSNQVNVDYDVDTNNDIAYYSFSATAPAGTSYLRVEAYANGDFIKLDQMCLSTTSQGCTAPTVTAGSNSPVSVGGTINLTSSGGGTYSWVGPNGFTSTSQNPTRSSATTAMAGVYTVTVTGTSTCTASATVNVSVNSSSGFSCPGGCESLNLISNPQFEANLNSWTSTNGGTLTTGGGGTYGNFIELNVGDLAGTFTVFQDVNFSANAPYKFVGYAAKHGVNNLVRMYLEFYNGATYLSKTADFNVTKNYDGTFQTVNFEGTTPANTTKIRIVGWAQNNALKFDNVSLVGCTPCFAVSPSVSSICSGQSVTITASNCSGTVTWNTGATGTSITVSPSSITTYTATCNVISGNLLNNPGFEMGNLTSWDNWANTSITSVSSERYSGTFGAKVTATLSGGGFAQSYPTTPGESFTMTAWGRVNTATPWSGVGIQFFNSSYTGLGSTSVEINATSSFQQYTVTAVAPAGAAFAQTYSWSDVGAIMYLDDLVMTEVLSSSTSSTTISVNTSPTANAGSNSPVTSGGSINLTSSGGGTYSWAGPNGFNSTTQNPTRTGATAAMAGVYTVTVTAANGCTATATTNVTISGACSVTASATSNSPLCAGSTLNLTGSGSGGTSQQLATNGNFNSGNTGFLSDYTFPSFYNVTSNPISVWGWAPSCTAYGGSGNMMIGDGNGNANSRFWYQTVNVTAGVTYTLSFFAFDFWGGSVGAKLQWGVNGTKIGSVLNLSTGGCNTWQQLTTTWTATTTGTATFAIFNNEISGANNDFAIDEVSILNTTTYTYSWTGPGSFTSTQQNPTRTAVTSTASGVYTLSVTSNGCTATATTNVVVNTTTVPTTTGATRCGTGTATLTATGCSGTYNWYAAASGGTSLGTGASFTTPSISSTTTYFVDCTVGTCVSTRASAVATVNSAPITPVATVVSTGCTGSTGSINITNLPDGLSSNINGGAWTQYKESYTDLAAGTYTIGFQGTNGCNSSASFTVTTSTDNPLLSLAKTDPTCTTTGSITVTGSGGTTGLGDASYDLWLGISGETVPSLTSNANYPNSPSVSTMVGILEGYINSYDNFGGRISGYIVPPTTGTYFLWIASDDYSELWLSSNSNAANKALVASVGGWTGSREWNKFTTQKTAALNLVAGQIYYFEALYKEGGGGDHIAIGWARPGEGTTVPSEVITGKHVRPNIASSVTTPVYQYRINSGAFQSSNTFTGLAAGTYTITIQDAGGCTATSTIALSIAGLTAPTATGASRCGAGTVTLTASGCSGTYNWYAASTGGASLGTGATFTTPSLSTTTTYFVDCNNGTCTSTRNAATATINPVPAAPTTTDNSRCGNGTVTLTASGCSGGQINWFAAITGGSAIASNTATYTTPSLTAPTSVTYYVACTLGSCTSTTRTAITANAFAVPTATAGSNSPVVEDADIYLTSSGGNSYSWVGPNSYTSQAQNPVIFSAAPSMAGVYTVTVTSNGCVATATTQVVISGGSTGGGNSCTGSFVDNGGALANYSNNQDVTQTFCADIGKNQRLTFTSFALENNADFLYVYDGPSVNSPLIGIYTGTSIPSTITSSESCLTVRFTSNATNTAAGWDATLSCVDPATSCVGPNMTFSNPTLISGTAGADGAQYRFSNILPGVDGIITIMSRTHADISIFDIDANAATYGGYEYGFQPLIDYNYVNGGGSFDPAGEKSVTFKLDFVNAGTTTARSIPALNMTAIDVDGSGEANEIMEFIETSGHNYFERQTTSTLTITGANSGGTNKAKGPITNYPNIDETAFDVMIGYYYTNVSSITFKYGADYGGSIFMGDIDINNSDEKRRNSLSFKCYNLNLQSAINISGTVWNDANGSAANTFNNIYTSGESGTNASGGIHAVLTNSSGTVIQTTPVSADGTFLFTGVAVNQNGLQIRITTSAGTVGSAAPASGIPSGWINTSPLTHTSFNVTTTDVVGKDFGIQRPPTSDDKTAASQNNPGGTIRVQTPSLSGNDPEDGVMGTGQTFVIKTLPTNGILYYNNVPVVAGQVINSYNPTLLTVDPNDGALTVTFTYAARDNAGYEDLTPATVTMPFTCPSTTLTATNGSRCGTGTVALSVSGCSGGTVSWFSALTGGSALATGLTYTTPSISTTTNYFASCTIGGCSSASRTTVTATVNTIPTATATGDIECVGSTISLAASGGNSYSWVGPASFSSTLQNPTRTSATTAMGGIYTVTVTSAQGCTATATASVSVASITLSSVVSACINQPLQDVATVDVTVSWTNAPSGDRIQVIINGKTEIVDVAGGVTSPQVIRFIVPANGITNQNITASWVNLAGCTPVTSTFNAPAACSSDNLSCEKILYLCGPDKPADGDAFDHGFINYLISQNANIVTPAFTKPDASGFGLYDVVNNTSALSVNLNDYTMVIVSPTTEANLAVGLLNALKGYAGGVLMMNYTEADDLGLTNGAGFYNFQNNAYINNTNQIPIYNYDNTNPSYSEVFTGGNYFGVADAYLWFGANNMSSGTNGIYFYYSPTDVLAGVPSTHGARTYLGYHMNGLYSNSQNGGAMPAPTSSYFVPSKHLTLEGKLYFDQAIRSTATSVKVTATGDSKCAGTTINLTSTGTGAVSYQWAGPNGFSSTLQNPSIANATSVNGGIYTVTATGVGGCTATATASVTVTTIAAPTSAGAARCGTGTVALTATGCAGGTISWFSSATGGVALTTGANYTTPSIATTTNYFISCTLSGCTSTTRNTVTATINTIPTASATGDTECVGSTISLTASGGNTYAWSGPNGFNSTVQNPSIPSATTAMAGIYTVTVTSAQGCSATATANVIVNTIPAAPTSAGAARCGTGTVALTATGCAGGTISWFSSATGGVALTTGANYTTPSIATTTNYFVECTLNGCISASRTTVTATINTIPTASATGDTECVGSTISLTASGGNTYAWSGPNGFNSTVQNPTIASATTAMAGVYTVTVTSAQGCSATATANVIVNTIPAAPTSAGAARCGTGTVALTATGCAGGTISWFSSATGGVALTTGANYTTPSISTTTNYFVECTLNGCISASRTTVTATINTIPTASATGDTECVGSTISLTASGGNTYTWSGPNGFNSTVQNPTIASATTAMAGVYTVTVTSAQGCSATATANVIVNTLPAPAVTGTTVCVGGTITLNASGGTNYNWNGPNGFTATGATVSRTSAIATMAGVYTITVTNANGCTATTTAAVAVNNLPIPTATGSTVCVGSPVNLTSSGGNSYLWAGPNSFTSTAQNPSIANATTAMGGVYTVTAYQINGTATNIVRNITGFNSANFSFINSTNSFGGPQSLFNAIDDDNANSFHASMATSGQTYGISYNLGSEYYISNLSIDARNDCCTERGKGGVMQVYNQGVLVYQSNTLTGSGNGVISATPAPNVVGDQVRYVFLNGAATSSGEFLINFTEWNIEGNHICSATATANVIVNTIPAAPTSAGAARCGTGTVALTATGCAGGTISWFSSATGGVALTTGANYTTPSIATTTNYFVECTLNGCISASRTTVTATINTIPTASATGDTECVGSTISLTASGGNTYAWSGSNGFNSTVQNPTIASATTAMAGVYTVTVTSTQGCSATATANVIVNTIPAAPTSAGAARCGTGTVALTATGCAGGTISWFSSATGGVALTTGANYTTPSISTTTNYFVECTLNGCISASRTTVTATINTIPTASATSNTPVTAGGTINLTATGGGTYSWTGPNNFTSTLQNPNISNINGLNVGIYTVTVTGVGGCSATATTEVLIKYTDPGAVDCTNIPTLNFSSPTLISGTAGAVGAQYRFTNVTSGTDAIVTIQSKSHSDIDILALDEPAATYGGLDAAMQPIIDYNWINGGGSFDAAGEKSVTFKIDFVNTGTLTPKNIPVVTMTGVDIDGSGITNEVREFIQTSNYQSYETQNPTSLALSGTAKAKGGYFSYYGINDAIQDAMISFFYPNVNSITVTYGAEWGGATADFVDFGLPNSDEIRLNSLSFKCYDLPNIVCAPVVAPTVTNNSRCGNGTVTLSASGCTSGTISWYSSLTGGTALATGGTYTTPTLTNTTNYYVECLLVGCTSSPRTMVTATINTIPTASATGGTFCESVTINLTASGGSTYSWIGPNGYTAIGASISRGPATVAMAGIYTVTVTSTAGCTATTTVTVTINTLPNSPTVANMQRCAAGTVTLTASGCSGGTISWFDSQNGTAALNVGTNFVTPNLSESRFYFASCSSNNCISPTRTTVQVTINSLPVAEATGINSTCMSNVAANNGKLVLSKFLSTDQYSYNLGSTYNSSTATALVTIPANGEILTGITNPATSQTYNIRIVNTAGCLIDRNVTISRACNNCPPDYCEKPTVTKQ